MARLIYASNMSLDGFTEDDRGALDWAPPDEDVFAFITDLMGSAGTYLYGRRMYQTSPLDLRALDGGQRSRLKRV